MRISDWSSDVCSSDLMTLCCCLHAACVGGPTGRLGAGLIVFKTIAEFYLALMDQSWAHTLYPILVLDTACLLAFLLLALRNDRHWPLWVSGCALAAVAEIGRASCRERVCQYV